MSKKALDDWAIAKEEEKREIEYHARALLEERSHDLQPHERFFLSETIGYVYRGLYGLARASLGNAFEDASEFQHYAMDPEIISKATPINLDRALLYLENSPVQEHPIFR